METANIILRKESIDGLPVFVIDNCLELEEAMEYYNNVMELSFKKGERDFEGDEYPIFSFDFDPISFADQFSIGRIALELMKDLIPDHDFTLFRSYVNMSHYGDVEYPHRDCEIGKGNITFLYYLNKTWQKSWGGETIFYENGDPKTLVMPKPGRCVIFFGEVEHMGSVPTRLFTGSRLTLALKYVAEPMSN